MRLPSCYMLGQTRILGLKELRWAWFSSFGGHHHYPGSSYYRVAQLSSSQSSATGGPHAAGKLQRCTPRAHCSHSPSCPQDPKTWELNNQSNDQDLPFQKWCSLAQKGQQGSPAQCLPSDHQPEWSSLHLLHFLPKLQPWLLPLHESSQVPKDPMWGLSWSQTFWGWVGKITFSFFCASSNSKNEYLLPFSWPARVPLWRKVLLSALRR